ncbi:hypothetical protein [Pseudomonas fluorescens]|uniref:Uncharacterized protein n=1 Tax=Pseudomonas fluorescens TaxID=294 RepID=A0A423KXP0_PSEFL|nr:hypothetical protein [Pseudomonas fluorescens]RON60834.1 hypothetical protein BK671_25760 [Pseudomonas fluorescens]
MHNAIPFVLHLTPGTIAANQDSAEPTLDEQIVTLHKQGFGRRKIMLALSVGESQVRRLTKGIAVEGATCPATTPFERAVKLCYPMAVGRHGLKDYQLREILFRVYGSTWNAATGKYDGLYNEDSIYRVRKRIRELAAERGDVAVFPMDWFDTSKPLESNHQIRRFALSLAERVQDVIDDYILACGVELMTEEGLPTEQEANLHQVERIKQVAAARLHILKLAIPELSPEPVNVLMDRAEKQAESLARTPDIEVSEVQARSRKDQPEPTRTNAFLDYVESRGWLASNQ